MQFLNTVTQKGAKLLTDNASVLLTAAGVVGTVSTAVLAGRAGYKYAEIIRQKQDEYQIETLGHLDHEEPRPDFNIQTKAKAAAPYFIPPIITSTATVAAIIVGHRVSAQKAAALAAAYGLAERNLSEYKEKVAEKLTGPKKEQLETEIAQDRVNQTPGSDKVVVIEGSDDCLCFDKTTGRYFKSNPEKIRRAVNATNAEIIRHNGAGASFFYEELELPRTTLTDELGWGMGAQMDIIYSYVNDPNDKPVLAIDFKQMPSIGWEDSRYR